jgi:glucokinase
MALRGRPLIAAIDIGATKTMLAVRPLDSLDQGWRVGDDVVRTESAGDPSTILDWIVEHVGAARARHEGTLIGIGVAAPGPIDVTAGIVTRSSNLGWQDVAVAPYLAKRLGAPVALEDDANAATLGEWGFGGGKDADPFCYLTISTGVGSGIVIGGDLVRGRNGNAGEVGHLVLDPRGPVCNCGRRGDIESYVGGRSLARRAQEIWPDERLPDGRTAPRTAADIFTLAVDGNAEARTVVSEATRAVAMALAVLAATLEPRRICVGGSLGLGQARLVSSAVRLARRLVMRENGRSLEVVPARLGEQSVLAGAALIALRAGNADRGRR